MKDIPVEWIKEWQKEMDNRFPNDTDVLMRKVVLDSMIRAWERENSNED